MSIAGAARGAARRLIDRTLERFDLALIAPKYLLARKTIAGARRLKASPSAYSERLSKAEGTAAQTLERLASVGVLGLQERVCEMGAGAGRYLETLLSRSRGFVRVFIYNRALQTLSYVREMPRVAAPGCEVVHRSRLECMWSQPTLVARKRS